MIKICHLRGDKNYWNITDPTDHPNSDWRAAHHHKFHIFKIWEKIRNFNFLDYRKKIRDVVIQSIIDSNEYDIICYNDEEFKQTLSKINDNDIIGIHCQDDDDLYLGSTLSDTLEKGIYNAPNLVVNYRNKTYVKDCFKEVTAAELLQGQAGSKVNITGSCNLIMVGDFYIFKDILNSVANNSFGSRHRLNGFIFNWDHTIKYRIHEHNHELPIKRLIDPITIEYKHFFSFGCLCDLHRESRIKFDKDGNIKKKVQAGPLAKIESSNLELIDKIMCDLFYKEYSRTKNINIKDVIYWNQLQAVYEDFNKKLH